MAADDSGKIKWRTIAVALTADNLCTLVSFPNKDLRTPELIKGLEIELADLACVVETKRLVIDFSGVEYAASAVFGLVLKLVIDVRSNDIAVRACSMTPIMQKAFTLLGPNEFTEMFDDAKRAIESDWEKPRGWWKSAE